MTMKDPSTSTSHSPGSSGLTDTGRAAVATASSEVHDLTSQAVDQAADVLNDVRGQVRERADAEARRAAEAIGGIGQQLRTMADRADQDSPAVRWVREAGERSQRVADRLEEGGPQGLVDDVQRFARRRPGVFLAGMGFAGLVVGRMLRNSSAVTSSSPSDRSGGWTGQGGQDEEIDLRADRSPGALDRSSSTSGLSLEAPDNLSGSVPSGIRSDADGVRSDG